MKSGNVFCQSLCTRRANGSKQQDSYQFTSFFGTKGVKQGIDRRRGQGTGIPTTLLQDSVKKGTVNAATTLKQYKVVQTSCPKKTSCPKMCCQTIQFVEIYKFVQQRQVVQKCVGRQYKLSKRDKVEKNVVSENTKLSKMCCQKIQSCPKNVLPERQFVHTHVLHNTRSTYHHHHGAP